MFRIVRLEAKRSIALPLLLVLAALTRAFLWMDIQEWAASWASLVQSARAIAWVSLPVVLAAGIWHGGREGRNEVSELFAATPRPRPVRLLPAFVAIVGAVVIAEAGVVAWAATLIARHATYSGGQWPLGLAVGLLAAIAVTLLGLGIGRAVATPVAAPLAAVALFLVLAVSADERPANRLVDVVLPMLPKTDDFHRVLPSLSVSQCVWFTALGATGVLLTVAGTRRARWLALTPAVAGIALAALLAPSGAIVRDPQATALVCARENNRICVTKVHTHALPTLVAPAQKVLDAFAEVPGGPERVEEKPESWKLDAAAPASHGGKRGTVRTEFPQLTQSGSIRWKPDVLLAALAQDTMFDEACYSEEKDFTRATDASDAVAALLLRTPTDELSPGAREAYDTLRPLPAKERYSRIGEGRKAGLTCGDPLAVIMGRGAGR
ncbi:hypothetical protein [Streptomyces reniochalinae]|uniref:Uncharacterized protein n=1 Tax=Streptomyces reniochalinae TaxID=2250578 RepID=A0A367F787_9ACTN|nr:hypothetical protein [Streptomyces reniochalinae]RCG25712.1 hypothetical protein DQ392_00195 [Streptomyces reniochalinae]